MSPRWAVDHGGDQPPARFIDWNPFPDQPDDEPGDCEFCDGHGWFTDCTEGSNGRDEDVDTPCRECGTSGVAS